MPHHASLLAPCSLHGRGSNQQYLKTLADLDEFFVGLEISENFYDARVDPIEPSRVWFTTRQSGKITGPLKIFGNKVCNQDLEVFPI